MDVREALADDNAAAEAEAADADEAEAIEDAITESAYVVWTAENVA